MAAGLSTMSLMRVTGGVHSASTTPFSSPSKELSKEGSNKKSSSATKSIEKCSSAVGEDGGRRGYGRAKSNLMSKLKASESAPIKALDNLSTGEDGSKQSSRSLWPQQRKGGVVLDLIVECDVDSLWDLFTKDGADSKFWKRFVKLRKYEEVSMGLWSNTEEKSRQRERNFEYITGFKSHFIRGKHKTYETHLVTLSLEGKAYAMQCEAKVPTIPVGDCMYTVIQYCFGKKTKTTSFLQATYEVVYTKKTYLKGTIEKSSASGIKENMKDVRATLKTIVKVRDALPSHLESRVEVGGDSSSKFDTMVTHGVFRFLMQYPHAVLALACSLYLIADRIYRPGKNHYESLELVVDTISSGEDMLETSDETCGADLSGGALRPADNSYSDFCAHAVMFWLLGYLFKFLVLASHWIITNLSILLKPFFLMFTFVANSEVVRKCSIPVKRTVTAMLRSLEIRKMEINTTSVPESESHSPASVVPAAAEAALVVSKIAKLSGLSPAAQAEAVKGLRDRKQAQLVNNVTSSCKEEESGLVVEEVFENQRYQPFRGWGSSWPGHLLPTDCGKWSNRLGLPKVGTQSQMFELVAPALPPNWVWLETEWQIDLSGTKEERTDKDGFYYGIMAFSGLKDFPPDPGSGKKTMKQFIRRRRWSRTRIHSVKISDVLMGKNVDNVIDLDAKDGSSLKQKIETLLGWRKAGKAHYDSSEDSQLSSNLSNVPSTKGSIDGSALKKRRSSEILDKDVVLEEIFEQEQRVGSHQWTDPINAKNLKRWSCRDGSISSATFKEAAPALPSGFKWVGHWNIDNSTKYSDRVDEDGWTYGQSFWPILIHGENTDFPTGSRIQTESDKARRRRWIRHARKIVGDEEDASPEAEDLAEEPKASPQTHNSKQLDALDLPPSPSEKDNLTMHKRNASEHLFEVLDLSTTASLRDEEYELGECPTPTMTSPQTEHAGPLAAGLRRLSNQSLSSQSPADAAEKIESLLKMHAHPSDTSQDEDHMPSLEESQQTHVHEENDFSFPDQRLDTDSDPGEHDDKLEHFYEIDTEELEGRTDKMINEMGESII